MSAIDPEAMAHLGRLRTTAPATGAAGYAQRDDLIRAHVGRFAFLDGSELVDDLPFCVVLEDDKPAPVRLVDDRPFCVVLEDGKPAPVRLEDDRPFCVLLEDDEEAPIS